MKIKKKSIIVIGVRQPKKRKKMGRLKEGRRRERK